MKTAVRTVRRISDDLDALYYAREIHRELKQQYFPKYVGSKVARVGNGFSINDKLEITIEKIGNLRRKMIPVDKLPIIYRGALLHEDAHAFYYPVMQRINIAYAVGYLYAKAHMLPWNQYVYKDVLNIMSDVFNEIIMVTTIWERALVATRYYYAYFPNKQKHKITKNDLPSTALLKLHNIRMSKIYLEGGQPYANRLRIKKPRTVYEKLYNILVDLSLLVTDDESHKYAILESDIYDTILQEENTADLLRIGEMTAQAIAEDNTGIIDKLRDKLRKDINMADDIDVDNPIIYTKYFYGITAGVYHVEVLAPPSVYEKSRRESEGMTHDNGELLPDAPPAEILENIIGVANKDDILPPQLADHAAKQLVKNAIMVKGYTAQAKLVTGERKVAWYRRPRGKLDPLSMVSKPMLEWKVRTRGVVGVKAEKTGTAGFPDTITIVIDESGSTLAGTAVLSRITGVSTTVYDVERVTAMSLLHPLIVLGASTRINIVRFSDTIETETYSSPKKAYARLKDITATELMLEATNIAAAVAEAAEHHRDSPKNAFIILTDMRIESGEARTLSSILRRIRRSPILVVGVNADVHPDLLPAMKKNKIAVSIKSYRDYDKLERAVTEIAKITTK